MRLAVPQTYELDGGTREVTDRFSARVVPHAVAICVHDAELANANADADADADTATDQTGTSP